MNTWSDTVYKWYEKLFQTTQDDHLRALLQHYSVTLKRMAKLLHKINVYLRDTYASDVIQIDIYYFTERAYSISRRNARLMRETSADNICDELFDVFLPVLRGNNDYIELRNILNQIDVESFVRVLSQGTSPRSRQQRGQDGGAVTGFEGLLCFPLLLVLFFSVAFGVWIGLAPEYQLRTLRRRLYTYPECRIAITEYDERTKDSLRVILLRYFVDSTQNTIVNTAAGNNTETDGNNTRTDGNNTRTYDENIVGGGIGGGLLKGLLLNQGRRLRTIFGPDTSQTSSYARSGQFPLKQQHAKTLVDIFTAQQRLFIQQGIDLDAHYIMRRAMLLFAVARRTTARAEKSVMRLYGLLKGTIMDRALDMYSDLIYTNENTFHGLRDIISCFVLSNMVVQKGQATRIAPCLNLSSPSTMVNGSMGTHRGGAFGLGEIAGLAIAAEVGFGVLVAMAYRIMIRFELHRLNQIAANCSLFEEEKYTETFLNKIESIELIELPSLEIAAVATRNPVGQRMTTNNALYSEPDNNNTTLLPGTIS